MILATYEKQPWEVLDCDMSFSNFLQARDDAIGQMSVIAPDGITLLDGVKAPSHQQGVCKFWVAGGAHGRRYKFTVRVETAAGRKVEHEILVKVVEY